MDLITQASRRLASGVCTNIYTAVCGGRRRHESGEKLIIHAEGGQTLESRDEKETATYDTFSRHNALKNIDPRSRPVYEWKNDTASNRACTVPFNRKTIQPIIGHALYHPEQIDTEPEWTDEVFHSEEEEDDDTSQSEEEEEDEEEA